MHALELLGRLRADGVDARLLLAGVDQPGRERYLRELRARVDALGLRDAVALTEPLANMGELYAMSDLVLQLSDKPESFGRTVVEALCSGRAVLGWDHGGVGELLRELYPEGAVALGDADALAQRAKSLLAANRPSIRLPDRYTLARMQADTLALYARKAQRSVAVGCNAEAKFRALREAHRHRQIRPCSVQLLTDTMVPAADALTLENAGRSSPARTHDGGRRLTAARRPIQFGWNW